MKRLPKVPEPPRPKGHWDYLCEEMQWLSADFAQERRWKRGVARKVCPVYSTVHIFFRCAFETLMVIQVVVAAHTFNLSTRDIEAGKSVNLRPVWSTEQVSGQEGLHQETVS